MISVSLKRLRPLKKKKLKLLQKIALWSVPWFVIFDKYCVSSRFRCEIHRSLLYMGYSATKVVISYRRFGTTCRSDVGFLKIDDGCPFRGDR